MPCATSHPQSRSHDAMSAVSTPSATVVTFKRVSQLDDGPDDGLGARICQYVDDQVLVEFTSSMGSLRRYVKAE